MSMPFVFQFLFSHSFLQAFVPWLHWNSSCKDNQWLPFAKSNDRFSTFLTCQQHLKHFIGPFFLKHFLHLASSIHTPLVVLITGTPLSLLCSVFLISLTSKCPVASPWIHCLVYLQSLPKWFHSDSDFTYASMPVTPTFIFPIWTCPLKSRIICPAG